MLEIKEEVEFGDLEEKCWGYALDVLDIVSNNEKQVELIQLLEDMYQDRIPTLTEVNDFLSMDSDTVFDCLDIDEDEEDTDDWDE